MRLGDSRPSAALVLLASTALAWQPPTFPTQAELVTVDVLVVDSEGKPVSGLAREDFRVLEDGHPQALTGFEEIEARLPSSEPQESVAPRPSAARFETNLAPPPTRRTFGIVFDDIHIDVPHAAWARKALQDFVARGTRPGDRLLLLTTSDGRFWTSTRGAGSQPFDDALARLSSRRPSVVDVSLMMTPVEAMKISERGDWDAARRVRRRRAILSGTCQWDGATCDCSARTGGHRAEARLKVPGENEDRCQDPPGAESADEVYALAVQGVERTLRVLREAIDTLGGQRSRKVLVLVSEGFLQDTAIGGFREVRDAAARANVVLHFLDPRGLQTRPEVFGVTAMRALPPEDLTATAADWRQEAEGARLLAEDTGGLSLQTNDLGAALRRIADESRVTYLLGYEPKAAPRRGVYHKLKVEMLRPGLSVRARAGYFAAKDGALAPAAASAVERTLQDPFDATAIPLRLATYVLGPTTSGDGKVEVVVAGELRRDALEARVVEGRSVAEPRLLLAIGSRDRTTRTSEWPLSVPMASDAEASAGEAALWHPFQTSVPMTPGEHRVRVAVQSGSRIGSVTTDVVVPAPGGERLSTPILSNERSADKRLPLTPVPSRTFASSDTLYCWFELFGAKAGDGPTKPRVSASFRARSAEGEEWAAGPLEPAPDGRPAWLIGMRLGQVSLGEHELAISVRNESTGHAIEVREPFRVEARTRESSLR